jgi:light-regulated signal transduction histidine kinase (bacteriophytochrome)
MRRELEIANQELEMFAYSVSHDLRAPLRTIDGFSQALLEDYQDKLDEEGKDYLMRIRAASQRMGLLINSILQLSRLGRNEMRLEEVDLSGLAQNIAAELETNDPDRKVDFVIEKDVKGIGDKTLLRAVMENLLGNAWKFTQKQAEAKIEFGKTEKEGKTIYFIRDNGVGFDMKYANKLFIPFQRLHSDSEFAGTGVGLTLVQRIVRRHGGDIWVESAVEKGATFYFTLER